jgi:cell division protein FtsQ
MGLINTFKGKRDASRPEAARKPQKIELKKYVSPNRIRDNLRKAGRPPKTEQGFWRKKFPVLRLATLWGLAGTAGLLFFFAGGLGLVYAYNYFSTSPYFAVKSIDIQGQNRLRPQEILDAAGLSSGLNILALSIDELENALAANPWVAESSVKRILPDGIRIKLREYEPSWWINAAGELSYADAYGTPIAPVGAEDFVSLPLLEIEPGAGYLSEKLPEAMGILEQLHFPLSLSAATRVRLTAARTLEMQAADGARLVIGLDHYEQNAVNLVRVLEDLSRRGELKQTLEVKAHGRDVWVARRGGF